MNDYVKYKHVEKLGSTEVEDILLGTVYVFPKIDGTNAHVWWDGMVMHYGNRNRELSLLRDHAGFMEWAVTHEGLTDMCIDAGVDVHIFGEWLVPHSLKTYREDAWRKFYVFDITKRNDEDGIVRHYHYDKVRELCEKHGVDYIPPIRIIRNPTDENVLSTLEENTFLLQEGKGVGEGVVLKNYDFVNKYGRQTWAKIVTSEFKEKHHKEMGAPISSGSDYVEEKIVDKFLSTEIIDKVYANIVSECDGWSSKYIPRLLHTVWYDFIRECSWDFIKAHKNPKINYKTLMNFVTIKINRHKQELF